MKEVLLILCAAGLCVGGYFVAKKNTPGQTAFQREKAEGKQVSIPKALLIAAGALALGILLSMLDVIWRL